MKVQKLKKLLARKYVINGVIIGVLALLFTAISAQESSMNEDLEVLTKDSAYIKSDITSSQEKNNQIVQSIEVYKTLPTNKLTSAGLDDLVSRIRAARTLKEELEARYKLQDLSVKFTPVEDVSQKFDVKNSVIYSNNIEMKFLAPTDEVALSFCDSIMKESAGYISIKKLELSRKGEFTRDMLDKLRSRSIPTPYLVETSVVFNWRSLGQKKDIQPQDNSNPSEVPE